VNSKDWKYRLSIERQFERELRSVAALALKTIKGQSDPQSASQALLAISELDSYKAWAEAVALKMVKAVMVQNAKTWREAARKSTRSHEIHEALRAEFIHNKRFWQIVNENAGYIRSLPVEFAQHVTTQAANFALAGQRPVGLMKEIQKTLPDVAESRARLIARTEVAKAQATITQVRSEHLGIDWYIWRTVKDQRVRSSHKHMEGVLCQFSSPPAPEALKGEPSQGNYGPGGIYNCRCFSQPLLDIDSLDAPIKAVTGNQIQRVSKKRFLELQ
jgi:SPP1 gp7 family putative phage head morphogenesis protein